MTTNPSIPEAAIDAGADACDNVLTEHQMLRFGTAMGRRVVEAVLHAAAPHLVGELVKVAREEHEALGEILKALLVVKTTLEQPYTDDPRWSPWTRFVDGPFEFSSPWLRATKAHGVAAKALRELEAPSE